MSEHEGDIGTFLRTMTRGSVDQRSSKPFIGIDECFNRREIDELTTRLLRRGHIDSSGPLWFQTRVKDGVPIGTFMGGVDRDSAFRDSNFHPSGIGVPLKLSIATKNQPFSQVGWGGCDSLIATISLSD